MTAAIPYSRKVAVLSLPKTGQIVRLTPSADERAAIAAFLDIPAVDALVAELTVAPSRGGSFRVTGEVQGAVQQLCVVSLEPFATDIREDVDIRYALEEDLGPVSAKEVERTLADEDPPEPLIGGQIDLGALAVETLALGLDPYPRKPGVDFQESAAPDARESPFAALAALKKPSGS